MAQVFDKELVNRSVTTYTAAPEDIVLTKDLTGRKEQSEVEALAYDIFKNGQNTPVLIRKNDEDKPVLVYGHRRVAAIKYVNKHLLGPNDPKILVQCVYQKLSDIEALTAAIGENRFRKDVSPVDDAHNIGVLTKRFKLSPEKIAEIYFPEATTPEQKAEAVRWVKVRGGLTELAEEAKEAVRDGRLTVTAASEMAKLPKEKQRKVIEETKSTLKGKSRIKVADVKKQKPAPVSRKAAASAPSASAKAAPAPAVKATGSIYAAAEELARAVDVWLVDATSEAEKALIAAHKGYRALVPPPKTEGKAA
jgi:ParB-like chromosome segregation protein Spo0J